MSTPDGFYDPYTDSEISLGRRAPYSQLGDWVSLSGVASEAKDSYWTMFMHAFNEGDIVQSPRAVLALLQGAKQPRTVDVYIRQLEAIGAVSAARHRPDKELKSRNRYKVHQEPPAAYDGPRSIADLYHWQKTDSVGLQRYYADRRQWLKDIEAAYQERLKTEAVSGARKARAPMTPAGHRGWLKDCVAMWKEQRSGASPMPARSAPQRTCENSGPTEGQNGPTPGRPVVRSSALRSAPQRTSQPPAKQDESAGGPVVRHSAHKEDVSSFSLSPSREGGEREEAAPKDTTPQQQAADVPQQREGNPSAAQVADAYAVAHLTAVGMPPRPHTMKQIYSDATALLSGGRSVENLVRLAAELPAKGWSDLAQHAAKNPERKARPAGAKPWCGKCDSPEYRWIVPDKGAATKCSCHPSAPLVNA